ncbi:hypothetical protein CDAR_26411 [Caerostris darwini]|uniref:Uncharacterized protein n=1 Tax=Caerostris darwini TaxID=1538125 RepID=A0AAV4QHU2_9ARAC|nr:hypothetical protein CDAR_26411 [Caerostris darwini]
MVFFVILQSNIRQKGENSPNLSATANPNLRGSHDDAERMRERFGYIGVIDLPSCHSLTKHLPDFLGYRLALLPGLSGNFEIIRQISEGS